MSSPSCLKSKVGLSLLVYSSSRSFSRGVDPCGGVEQLKVTPSNQFILNTLGQLGQARTRHLAPSISAKMAPRSTMSINNPTAAWLRGNHTSHRCTLAYLSGKRNSFDSLLSCDIPRSACSKCVWSVVCQRPEFCPTKRRDRIPSVLLVSIRQPPEAAKTGNGSYG